MVRYEENENKTKSGIVGNKIEGQIQEISSTVK